MARIRIPHNWTPRPYQKDVLDYFADGGKRAVLAWHRRSGKDDVALHHTAIEAVQRPAQYWHLLPQANQSRRAIWEAINPHTGKLRREEAFPPEIVNGKRDDQMRLELATGATWQVLGSDNADALVGTPPLGVTFSEYALSDPIAWSLVRPILLENDGWALFVSTPRGSNHFKSLADIASGSDDWFYSRQTVDDTGMFTQAQLDNELTEMVAEHGREMGEALFQQEYYVSFHAAILGSYFGGEMQKARDQGRVADVPHDSGKPVTTAWDIGVGDSTVIWFAQWQGSYLCLIDYYETSGVGADHYAKILREKPYTYDMHLLPHDVANTEWGTGKTRVETLAGLGIQATAVPRVQAKDDAINAARRILPRCRFDKEKCARGIAALEQYQREWDDRLKIFKSRPRHDWASHPADAFQQLAMGIREPSANDGWGKPIKAVAAGVV